MECACESCSRNICVVQEQIGDPDRACPAEWYCIEESDNYMTQDGCYHWTPIPDDD